MFRSRDDANYEYIKLYLMKAVVLKNTCMFINLRTLKLHSNIKYVGVFNLNKTNASI